MILKPSGAAGRQAEYFCAKGAALCAGRFDDPNISMKIASLCCDLINDSERRKLLMERGMQLVDVFGARRAVEFLSDAYVNWQKEQK